MRMLNRRGLSKRNLLGFLAFIGMVLSFQNCGQNLATLQESSPASGVSGKSSNAVSPNQTKSIYEQMNILEIPESPVVDDSVSQAMSSKLGPDSLFASKRIYLDPKNGQIKILDQNGNEIPGANFCLNEDDQSELQAILSSAEICEESEPAPQQVCAQDFKYPYAKLHMEKDVVSVGESYSSCHKGPDLCGEYSGLLKNFLSYILANLKSMSCELTPI